MKARDLGSKRVGLRGAQNSLSGGSAIERRQTRSRGSLLVDVNGVIRFCSNSVLQFAGCTASDVVGKPIDSFLPGLPIRKGTPGYNVAVTTVLFDDHWLPLHVPLADGSNWAVQAAVAHLDIDGSNMLSVELKWSSPLAHESAV